MGSTTNFGTLFSFSPGLAIFVKLLVITFGLIEACGSDGFYPRVVFGSRLYLSWALVVLLAKGDSGTGD